MSIEVKHLTKEYGLQKAVNDISFSVNKGEIVGFIGPNGAGKSTTMKIITGYIRNFSGEVIVNGLELSKNLIDIKRQIGYLPEHNPLYLDMYVREYLRFVAGIHKLGKESTQRINNVIELTGLGLEQKKKIGSLSKGYRQRVGLASTLVHDPSVLILDEATTGLDPNQIIEIRNLIASVGQEKTVLLSTHIMQEVEAICHKVIIIDKGHIVMDEKSENVNSHSISKQQIVYVEFSNTIDQSLLKNIQSVIDVRNVETQKWIVVGNGLIDIRPLLFECAVNNSNQIILLHEHQKSLEEVFRELTKQ